MADVSEYLIIGRIISPYGLKGWVKVKSFTQPKANFIKYQECFITPVNDSIDNNAKSWKPVKIEQGKTHGKGLVVKFADVNDRNASDTIIKFDVAVKSEA